MIGDMQKWTPNIASIIEHAKNIYPTQEVISRMVSGEVHRTNYEEVCIRSRKLASALEKDGYKTPSEYDAEVEADKFGKIVIQDLGGRMMPINTYASELLRKLSKSDHYKDLDANQAILSMYESPLLWYNIPIIYLKKKKGITWGPNRYRQFINKKRGLN